ncbi:MULTISPECIES: LysR family transcriptional regulator [unclassified Bosea (in: a-proteobacteria)]|uniref:LysR family transcriptional regulator n=1 Tax=unclassified Bosea (in: a-proteobacteria) TaxID=2653178 RepID=UPI000F750417|nr:MULTISPECIES: LysR family transcriptional regulator [unclassified Bosea (in: a-proteobacteria)]AZO81543.1 LysR family transcriptional regulator [Bosea sp. Tri-49]RXT16463.1 LysR family transcriptional regulator [Bosea sp. Tri-39]RXT40162.1 LysR family transcriptional regulator [Bosea sp. Tri-54]
MDRLEAMRVFVSALDEGSLAGAGRRLGRSAPAVTRAINALEGHVGARLLDRTTRMIRLTEAGERYAAACRRVLVDLEEAELQAAGERAAPRGLLTLTAPVVAGTRLLRPLVDAFLDEQPEVQVRMLLLDRVVSLLDEGVDLALRIAHLPDSNLVALRVGSVRQIVCAAPSYLARHGVPQEPGDLAGHRCIAQIHPLAGELWTFPPISEGGRPRQVKVKPRLIASSVEAAIASAVDGHGLVRPLCYQVTDEVRSGWLKLVLTDCEPEPLPVHLVAPEGRLSVAKVRAFADFALPKLKARFAERVG